MKTVEPESEESSTRAPEAATKKEAEKPEEFPDPNVTIETSGGPSDDDGRPYTGPPPRN